MELTYNIEALGISTFLFNQDVEIEAPFFLLSLTDPSGHDPIYAILPSDGCNENWILTIEGTQSIYESLLDGIVYFQELGTWTAEVYAQDDNVNIDPSNATYIRNIYFQVS
jgi:hypothetical protein